MCHALSKCVAHAVYFFLTGFFAGAAVPLGGNFTAGFPFVDDVAGGFTFAFGEEVTAGFFATFGFTAGLFPFGDDVVVAAFPFSLFTTFLSLAPGTFINSNCFVFSTFSLFTSSFLLFTSLPKTVTNRSTIQASVRPSTASPG